MSQNNLADYGFRLPKGVAGQLYDLIDSRVDSLTAVGAIAFGAPVAQGTGEELCRNVTAVTDIFLGLALHTHAIESDGSRMGYIDKDRVSVMRVGRAWVNVSVAVVKNDIAYVTAAGTYTNVVGTNIKVGQFLTSSAVNGLAVLELNRPL